MNQLAKILNMGDQNFARHAAALVYQTGFAEMSAEKRRGDEASGLSVVTAMDVPLEQGRSAIDAFLDKMLYND
jgi:hypothetical protein